jgi:CHAT domain-containing protein/tetratricopeptide (TPR) repeat protein
MTTAAPPTAEEFVARLLATADARQRQVLIRNRRLEPEEERRVVRRLLEEIEALIGTDPRRMEQLCLDALALSEASGDDYLWAMARFKHGEACTLQNRNAEACALLDEAYAAFTRLGRPVDAARTRIIWVWATANLGGDAEAVRTARRARATLRAHDQPVHLATLDLNTGILHCMRGRYRQGTRSFRSALSLYQSLGMEERAGRARHNLGLALSRLGRYQEALRELEWARDAARHSGELRSYALRTRAIGETNMRLGRYAAALRSFEEATTLYRSLSLPDGTLRLSLDLADCYLRLNRPADALAELAGVDGHLLQVDGAAAMFEHAARRVAAHLMLDQPHEAALVLDGIADRANTGSAEDRVWLALQRATILLRDGLADAALSVAQEAATLARRAGLRPLIADARVIEGQALLALDDPDAAHRAARAAHRMGRAQGGAPLLHRVFELLGGIAERRRRPAVACRHYESAIEHFEREQRSVIFEFRDSFANQRTAAYERLALLHVRNQRPAMALATAERAKSRALADAINGSIELHPRGTADARRIARALRAARHEYAATHAWAVEQERTGSRTPDGERALERLGLLEGRIRDLVRRLQLVAPDDLADLYGASPASAAPTMPDGTALVEYFFSGDTVLRFIVDDTGVRGDVLKVTVAELERLLRTLRLNFEATVQAAPGEYDRLADQARMVLMRLYARLLDGAAPTDRYRSLVIVPHGLLHYVPFQALHDGEHYLVERVPVSYAPSAALYRLCRLRTRRHRGTALVLGHSAGGRLPHVLQEAARVGRALGVAVRLEAEATRSSLIAEGRRAATIHIAAHGQFRADAPLFSHVQLADGPLTTADVFNLDLPADLVVLSACETGRAVIGGGDELVGLSRAFLHAGAASLLVSQWRVDDASTALLMARFHQARRRGVGAADALRLAQRALISASMPQKGHSHPFFWAGFQLIGAP